MPFALAISPTNREFSIARHLTRHSFPNLVFKVRNRGVIRGRLVDYIRPAFPRYLFVDPLNQFNMMRERFGIVDFVRDTAERIATVPEHAISSLLTVADDEHVLPVFEKPNYRFKQGDVVIIRGSSLLAGQRAIFRNLVDENRAVVWVDWMGKPCPHKIDESDLECIESVKSASPKPKRRRRRRRWQGKDRQRVDGPPVN